MPKSTSLNILISGASVAGPALAYWLAKDGHRVTMVERAPQLRPGGYAVDIRGAAVSVIERMGLLDEVRAADTNTTGLFFVNEAGQQLTQMGEGAMGSGGSTDLEVMRDDLSRILYAHTKASVEYLWGDSIATLTDMGDSVNVTFEHTPPRTFDLVIGADGLHSHTRELIWGDEAQFAHSLGCYIAIFTTDNYLKLQHRQVMYTLPGKTAGLYSARGNTQAKALLMFKSAPLQYDRHDIAAQKQLVAQAFAGQTGWEVPRLLEAMVPATDFYFDAITQIKLPVWHQGRIALVGDAAYGPSPASGQGTSLALVGAYVLARELRAASGDYAAAFPAYQQAMATFVTQNQKIGRMAAGSLIEDSAGSIWVRNQLMRFPAVMRFMYQQIERMITKAANAIAL
ncbi:MAG TPA: FAD-dependent monooxygenase [Candidatus Saccharimonadia bacterium]|nr:FAD-dependent monooxygenase [Candidatus Saccharimonadia bacterium]